MNRACRARSPAVDQYSTACHEGSENTKEKKGDVFGRTAFPREDRPDSYDGGIERCGRLGRRIRDPSRCADDDPRTCYPDRTRHDIDGWRVRVQALERPPDLRKSGDLSQEQLRQVSIV